MSGRLVILPHKSWNVWNRDNREKVAKDEREFREQQEALVEKNNLLLQEQNLLILRDNVTLNNAVSSVTPFRLFENLEKAQNDSATNEEYMKEKEMKEKRDTKREGTAAWGLGEGSVEYGKIRPWYEKSSGANASDAAASLQERALLRIAARDPMAAFIAKPSVASSSGVAPTSTQYLSSSPQNTIKDSAESKSTADTTANIDGSEKRKKHKKDKRDDEVARKKRKSRHRDGGSDREQRAKRPKEDSTSAEAAAALLKEKDAVLAELRRRRLEQLVVVSGEEAVCASSVPSVATNDAEARPNSRWGGYSSYTTPSYSSYHS